MRRKNLLSFLMLVFLLALVSACCRPPKISSVSVSLIPQHRDWWCWAATTEMISDYYGHRVGQCESANFVHGTPPNCCTEGCSCWGSAWGVGISDIQNNWTHWNFEYTYTASSLTWDKLKETISTSSYCCKSPVQAIWWWTGGGGHVITIYGYAEAGGEKYVSYLNPWPPDYRREENGTCTAVVGGEDVVITYDAFVSSTIHTWGGSFYKFKYTGP